MYFAAVPLSEMLRPVIINVIPLRPGCTCKFLPIESSVFLGCIIHLVDVVGFLLEILLYLGVREARKQN